MRSTSILHDFCYQTSAKVAAYFQLGGECHACKRVHNTEVSLPV